MYLTEQKVLSPFQYGFRQGKSTQQAIFDLTKFIYSALNHKKLTSCVCLHVAKAFDSINHDLLLYKLSKLGLNDHSVAWFKSYLTRTQVVKFGNNVSTVKPVVTGIGQGTILWPLLFIIYINDIVSVIKTLKVNMYADDCILYTSGNDWKRMSLKIQPEIDNVHLWCTANRLKINESKSKVLLIGSRPKLSNVDYIPSIKLGQYRLSFCNTYKYLVVTLG